MTTTFPYVVHEPGAPVKRVINMSVDRQSLPEEFWGRFSDDPSLFYIVNGSLRAGDNYSGIDIRHRFATEYEGGGSHVYYASFSLSDVTLASAYEGQMRFTAWLTEARLYHDPETDPFVDAVDGAYPDEGYDYQPEPVKWKALRLPVRVEFSIYNLDWQDPEEYVRELKTSVAKRHADRAEKARIELEKRQAREAERQRQWEQAEHYKDTQPDGAELRALEQELAATEYGTDERRAFNNEKMPRLKELRMAYHEWVDSQPKVG
jgi:hypothetical protein